MKVNDHWNYWKFQFNWNKLEWVDPQRRNCNNNPFHSLTCKFYIKHGKHTCNIFWTLIIETNWIFLFFKLQEHIDALSRGIAFSSAAKKREKKEYTTSSTSVKNTSHEASVQIASVNKPQENEQLYDVVYIKNNLSHSKSTYK